jgi:hypothetical protein
MNRNKAIRGDDESAGIRRAARIEAEIEAILAGEEELMPSSGFVASVMDRVRQEAALPAPIPFPWMKIIPILLLAGGLFGWGAVELVRLGQPWLGQLGLGLPALSQSAQSWLTLSMPHLSDNLARSLEQAGWVALALGSSLVSWLVSRRLAGRGGLL